MYVHPLTGEKVPSVTTIISAGLPKPALVPWAARMAAEHAVKNWADLTSMDPATRIDQIKNAHQQKADKAADLGDLVHEVIEAWSTGTPYPEWGKAADPYMSQFIGFMTDVRPLFLESEVTLWSRAHGYAGTADWIADIGGTVVYGDNKTGRRVYPEVGLQLSALSHADFILRSDGYEVPMPRPGGHAALHIRPRSWSLMWVEQPEECFNAFLAAKTILNWTRNVAPQVLTHEGVV